MSYDIYQERGNIYWHILTSRLPISYKLVKYKKVDDVRYRFSWVKNFTNIPNFMRLTVKIDTREISKFFLEFFDTVFFHQNQILLIISRTSQSNCLFLYVPLCCKDLLCFSSVVADTKISFYLSLSPGLFQNYFDPFLCISTFLCSSISWERSNIFPWNFVKFLVLPWWILH